MIIASDELQKYIGYLYVSSSIQKRGEIKSEKRAWPEHWENVCRVSWIRIGPLSFQGARNNPHLIPLNLDIEVLSQIPDGGLLSAELGRTLCTLIDKMTCLRAMSPRDRESTAVGHHYTTLSTGNIPSLGSTSTPHSIYTTPYSSPAASTPRAALHQPSRGLYTQQPRYYAPYMIDPRSTSPAGNQAFFRQHMPPNDYRTPLTNTYFMPQVSFHTNYETRRKIYSNLGFYGRGPVPPPRGHSGPGKSPFPFLRYGE